MSDLTTLLLCLTLIVVVAMFLRFFRWRIKYSNEFSSDSLKEKISKLEKDNEILKRKAVVFDEHLSDLS